MTNIEALKELCAAIAEKAGESISPADIKGDTAAGVIKLITKAYKGESIKEVEELAKLTLVSAAGTQVGFTKITVTGSVGGSGYKYKNTTTLPAKGESLASWTDWDGAAELELDDSITIVVCEVDGGGLALAGGSVFINSNLGA